VQCKRHCFRLQKRLVYVGRLLGYLALESYNSSNVQMHLLQNLFAFLFLFSNEWQGRMKIKGQENFTFFLRINSNKAALFPNNTLLFLGRYRTAKRPFSPIPSGENGGRRFRSLTLLLLVRRSSLSARGGAGVTAVGSGGRVAR